MSDASVDYIIQAAITLRPHIHTPTSTHMRALHCDSQVEGRLSNQEGAVAKQSFTVKKLRQKVTQGVADPDMLERAEKVLTKVRRV